MASIKLDKLDIRILDLLQGSNMLTPKISEIAKAIGTTNATVYRRIEAMKRDGVIVGHTTKIDNKLIGKSFQAFIYLRMPRNLTADEKDKISNRLMGMNSIEAVYIPLGKWSYLIKTSHRDMEELNRFVEDELAKVPYEEAQIELILKVIKEGQVTLPKSSN
jgi:Lrp/AsnC family transcriptional regulator